ncbi:glycoside hydrolase family 114 protein, partial [Piromyces sp. E2]
MKFSLVATVASLLYVSSVQARTKFTPGLTWNYALSESNFDVNKEPAKVVVVDVHSSSAKRILELKNHGKKVICYFSGGSYEDFRPDKNKFKNLRKGSQLDGWDEYYVDVSSSSILSIMKERIAVAHQKGCDGIEVDNMDACQNDHRLHLSESDCINFGKRLSEIAHDYDLAIGLKNSAYIMRRIANVYDFAINESCYTHGKNCHEYKRYFLDKGKAVFSINY